eukprot:364259-Chlamydomonas_euryale.AAC.8
MRTSTRTRVVVDTAHVASLANLWATPTDDNVHACVLAPTPTDDNVHARMLTPTPTDNNVARARARTNSN